MKPNQTRLDRVMPIQKLVNPLHINFRTVCVHGNLLHVPSEMVVIHDDGDPFP